MKKEKYILPGILLLSLLYLSGCSVSEIQNSFKDAMSGNRKAIDQAEDLKTAAESNNPVFESEEGLEAKNAVAKDVDEISKKALSKVFQDVKLVSGGNTDVTPFILRYVVKRRINQNDGDLLYQELLNQGSRAKDGGSPHFFTERSTVEMSVFKEVGGRSYIIAVVMDLGEQIIWVNVY
jgi:hypothetical protein